MSYYLLFMFLSPYSPKYTILEKVESNVIKISLSNSLTTILCNIIQEENRSEYGWLFISYLTVTNGIFLLWWIQVYKGIMGHIFRKLFRRLIERISKKFSKMFSISSTKKEAVVLNKNIGSNIDEKYKKAKTLNKLLLEHIEVLERKLNQIPENEPVPETLRPSSIARKSAINLITPDLQAGSQPLNQPEEKDILADSIKSAGKSHSDKKTLIISSLCSKLLLGTNFSNYFLLLKYKLSDPDVFMKKNICFHKGRDFFSYFPYVISF